MDRAPADAEAAALAAIEAMRPSIELRRLRMRQAGGRQFADVVIGVPPGAAVGQGHAAADAVEEAVERALPNADVVVHVEPQEDATLRERVHAAAVAVPRVREVHNIALVDVDGRTELSLHLKLPGELSLDEAHDGRGGAGACDLRGDPGDRGRADAPRAADGGERGRGGRRGRGGARAAGRARGDGRASRASCASCARTAASSRS